MHYSLKVHMPCFLAPLVARATCCVRLAVSPQPRLVKLLVKHSVHKAYLNPASNNLPVLWLSKCRVFDSRFGRTKSQAGLVSCPGTMEEHTMGSKTKQVFVEQIRQAIMQ